MTEYQGKTANDVRERMEVVMEARGEGLILKHPDGEYVLNGRNKDWIKVRKYASPSRPITDFLFKGETGIYGRHSSLLADWSKS